MMERRKKNRDRLDFTSEGKCPNCVLPVCFQKEFYRTDGVELKTCIFPNGKQNISLLEKLNFKSCITFFLAKLILNANHVTRR